MLKVTHKHAKYILLLTGLAFFTIAHFSTPAHAETVKYQAEVEGSLSLYVYNSTMSMVVDPSERPFDAFPTYVQVRTNNPTGYKLSMYSDSTTLIEAYDDRKTIPTLSPKASGYTENNFETNRWGYKINTGNYMPFVSGTQIADSDTAVSEERIDFTVATKVNFAQPSGNYYTNIRFTLVANPTPMILQDLDPAYCTDTPLWVVDGRDGEEYMIQRLADGKCWMLDNMRFDPTEVPLGVMKDKTNAPNEYLEYMKKGNGSSDKYPDNGVSVIESQDFNSESTYRSAQIASQYKDTVVEGTPGLGSGKVGIHYNYCAASGGTYCYPDNNTDYGNATYDICPAGWRLPAGASSRDVYNEYQILYNALRGESSSNTDDQTSRAFVEALSLPMSRYNGQITSGNAGYWLSAYSNYSEMDVVEIWKGSNYFGVGFGEDKRRDYLYPVRCLMEERTLNDIEYMQNVTDGIIANTDNNTVVTLKDRRDNQEYTVIKNGGMSQIWDSITATYRYAEQQALIMTRNLAIGCNGNGSTYGSTATGMTLNYATSNLENNWTMPTTAVFTRGNTDAHMLCDSNSGAWYNYRAAIGETGIESLQNDSPAYGYNKLDMCPAGWELGPAYDITEDYKDTFFSESQFGGSYSTSESGGDLTPDTSIWWLNGMTNPWNPSILYVWEDNGTITVRQSSYMDWGGPGPEAGHYVRCSKITQPIFLD